ncbi:MAG: SUMF1/EgtB/PvdO family nonheme iron enzyme [Planctomycetes bacterium]|jgi:formylglycine-generating enzyme required for sulfatase activity|nr:SUMF1/EgtB/PvdO family nonheme iron enzyme [Planctomycetota bacterium]MBT4029288.1 SUMF1/EgtB/PvdO family nonheme iron enzyme [Planctomycetota bacterium]MBT4561273.1 SUMF1/EgtB/PvdO family nonheme iron enzyme [Planctomycetota bacterium]MBT5101659.1 SUMF1/EgtB/PvdO family nonheme iron enzyme [Planctomycetota bacterium]MBT7012424.1 SUMF1/EgtB/PvdO family nonheme iron enzyme [Planctomycetota bacterium]
MRLLHKFTATVAVLLLASPAFSQVEHGEFVYIPGGTFTMGDHSGTGEANESPLHDVTLSPFWMDTHEVSVIRFTTFLNAIAGQVEVPQYEDYVMLSTGGQESLAAVRASQYPPSNVSITYGFGFNPTNYGGSGSRRNFPVNKITVYGARMYANWLSERDGYTTFYNPSDWSINPNADGYRLPTEAQWEYAARGNQSNYSLYPWGNTVSSGQANHAGSGDPWENSVFGGATPVGYYDGNQQPAGVDMANGFGLYDMIGNVREMCNDWWDPDYYSVSASINPTGPATAGQYCVDRGASFSAGLASTLRTANRYSFSAQGQHPGFPLNLGFRLVRPVPTPPLYITNFFEGTTARIQASGGMAGDTIQVAYSLAGPGPIPSPFGPADLSAPVTLLPTITADHNGVAVLNAPIPAGTTGLPVWFQAANINRGSLTNSLALVVESNATPVITSVSPNTGAQGSTIVVDIQGLDFAPSSQLFLESATQTFPFYSAVYGSSTSFEGEVDLSGATAGSYSVVMVKESGVRGELLDGFHVTPMDPVIINCDPSVTPSGRDASFSVSGEFIDQGATLRFVMGASTLYPTNSTISFDGRLISGVIDTTAPTGFYDVIVTDPDATFDVLVGGFEIRDSAFTFEMGDHGLASGGTSDELPLHNVYVDVIDINPYECTNELYSEFLNDAYAAGDVTVNTYGVVYLAGTTEALCDTNASSSYSSISFNGATFAPLTGRGQYAACKMSWYGAAIYANWRSIQDGLTPCYDPVTWLCTFSNNGWRLPTEAEWEYAARGGAYAPYYAYPWNRNDRVSSDSNVSTTGICNVGLYPPNGFGLYDMSGNVREWCNDWYDPSYYAVSPLINPTGPNSASQHVVRGGAWNGSSATCRTANRDDNYAADRAGNIGFRLVKNY